MPEEEPPGRSPLMKKLQVTFLSLAVGFGTLSIGCSGGGGSGSPGSGGSGMSSSGGSGGGSPLCPEVTPCDGSVVGTWTVSSSCLNVSGSVDPSSLGVDPRTCTSATVTGSLTVSGTF